MTTHSLSANPTHSVWNRDLTPRLHIAPGDTVDIQCVDASGSVAMRLRLSQVVNEPIHTVSAAISKRILPPRALFPIP